jgi:EF hand
MRPEILACGGDEATALLPPTHSRLEMTMLMKTVNRALIVAMACVSLHAAADTLPPAKMKEMMSLASMDTNKDGRVSREEFLAMMGKIYDMKMEDMGVKDGKIDAAQLQALHRALWVAAGGGQ